MMRRKMYAKFLVVLLCFCLTSSWMPLIVSQAVGIETGDEIVEGDLTEPEGELETETEPAEETETEPTQEDETETSEEETGSTQEDETETSNETETEEGESETSEETETTEETGTENGTSSTEETATENSTAATEAESKTETDAVSDPTAESTEEPMAMALSAATLAEMITNANAGDTITLPPDTTYDEGPITINKKLTIVGGENTIIKGDVTCYADITLENLEISGDLTCNNAAELNELVLNGLVEGHSSFKMQNCIANKGVEIKDSSNDITLWGNEVHFDGDFPRSGLMIATNNQSDPLWGTYKIGDTEYNDSSKANTFIFDGSEANFRYAWHISCASNQELNAYGNYWKKGDDDATFAQIKVRVNVVYSYKLPIKINLKNQSDVLHYDKQPNFNYIKGTGNTGTGYVEDGDYVDALYGRSFENRDAGPFIDEGEFNAVHNGASGTIQLNKSYKIKVASSVVYKDNTYTDAFSEDEVLNHTWVPGEKLYIQLFGPMMPAIVTPKAMISYEGDKSEKLSDSFPSVWYHIKTPNYLQGKSTALGEGEYFELQLSPAYEINPEGLPLTAGFYSGGSSPALINRAGTYEIVAKDKGETPELSYGSHFKNTWIPPDLFSTWPQAFDLFDTGFEPGELIIRPTSDNLTIKGVFSNVPNFANQSQPVAVMDGQTQHKDSTGQILDNQKVSLLNDNKEPNAVIYQTMIDKAKETPDTAGLTYEHHFLSFCNTNDGNNVVTNTTSKTIYIPYPANYKEGGVMKLLHFDNYQRMPSDSISTVTVIQGAAITKLEKGFTFTATGDLGAYLIAYDKSETAPPETTEAETTEAETTEAETTAAETTAAETTAVETTGSSGSGGGGEGGGNDRPSPTRPTAAPNESSGAAETISPENPLEPTPPVAFPEDPQQPATPNFQNPPGGGGSVVKGEDGLYYHISDDNVPLAYYDLGEDIWVPLGSFDSELDNLPKTGELWEMSFYLGVMMIIIAGTLLTVVTVRRRK